MMSYLVKMANNFAKMARFDTNIVHGKLQLFTFLLHLRENKMAQKLIYSCRKKIISVLKSITRDIFAID